jgi:hypothetical protein
MGLADPSFIRSRTPEEEHQVHYGFSAAFWLNSLWAIRHGHRLTKEPTKPFPERANFWNKVPAIRRMTEDTSCDVSRITMGGGLCS